MNFRYLKNNSFVLLVIVLLVSILAVNYSGHNSRQQTPVSQNTSLFELQLLQISREQKALKWRLAEAQYEIARGEEKGYLPINKALQVAKDEAGIANSNFLDSLEDICFRPDPATWRVTFNKEGYGETIVIDATTGAIVTDGKPNL